MPVADRLRETELALMNAPFEIGGWTRALELFASATGSAGANLVGMGGALGLSLNMFTGRDADRASRFFARPELWGSCNWRVNSSGPPLTIQHDDHYAAYRGCADTSDYDDAVSDLDMQFGCQSVLISNSRTFFGLALYRGRRQGACDASGLAAFQALLRPIHRSLRLQMTLSGEAADLMLVDLSALHKAVVLVDRHGCICAMSAAAEQLIEPDGPIRLGSLLFELSDRAESRSMQSALSHLLSNEASARTNWAYSMRAGRTPAAPQGRWIVRAFRLPRRDHWLGFDPHVAIAFDPCLVANPVGAGADRSAS